MHVFKIFIFDFKNVHSILDFLTRRGKLFHIFLIFIYFSTYYFPRNLFKKKRPRADWAKGPADGPPRASPLPARRRAAAGVRPGRPLPQASDPLLK